MKTQALGAMVLTLLLSACGAPPPGADEVAATRHAEEVKTKLCAGTRGPGGGSATCAESDACGRVTAADGKNYRGVCLPVAAACPELKKTYDIGTGKDAVTVTVGCDKGVTSVTYPKGVGTNDEKMRCYTLKKGDATLVDGRGNAYPAPTEDKASKFVCFAGDGGVYVWNSGGGSAYYDAEGTKAPLALRVDTQAPVVVVSAAAAEPALDIAVASAPGQSAPPLTTTPQTTLAGPLPLIEALAP